MRLFPLSRHLAPAPTSTGRSDTRSTRRHRAPGLRPVERLEDRALMAVAGWATQFGGTGYDVGFSVAVDSAGDVYTSGYFTGTAAFAPGVTLTSAGGKDACVVKYNPDGSFAWARRMGGTLDDMSSAIAVDQSGNVYTTGQFWSTPADFGPTTTLTSAGYGDIFLTKLDAAGDFLWSERMGGTRSDGGMALVVDSSGTTPYVYMTGFTGTGAPAEIGGITLTGNTGGAFVAKVDGGTGKVLWAEQMGSTGGSAEGTGVAIDGAIDGAAGVYVTGLVTNAQFGSVTLTGTPQKSGKTTTYSQIAFVTKLDSSGKFLWATGLGQGSMQAGGDGIAVTSNTVYVTGHFEGTGSFGATKLTSASNLAPNAFVTSLNSTTGAVGSWAKGLGDNSTQTYESGYGIAVDSTGTLSVAGVFSGSGTFLERMDAAGNVLSTWQASANGLGVAVDSGGVVYVTGSFQNTVTLNTGTGSTTLTSAGLLDGFLLKRDPQAIAPAAQPLGIAAHTPPTVAQSLSLSPQVAQPLIPLAPPSDQDLTLLASELIHSGTKRPRSASL
jgi:Beta-propeller repeat